MPYFKTYGNKKWTTAKKCNYDGRQYDSKFEATYAQELTLRKMAGEIKDFDTHKRMELVVNGYKICDYYIDFVIYHNDGTIEYAETKGFETPVWKLKWKLFEALFTDLPDTKCLNVIYQNSNKFYKKGKKLRV
jgi:hypothetical protein